MMALERIRNYRNICCVLRYFHENAEHSRYIIECLIIELRLWNTFKLNTVLIINIPEARRYLRAKPSRYWNKHFQFRSNTIEGYISFHQFTFPTWNSRTRPHPERESCDRCMCFLAGFPATHRIRRRPAEILPKPRTKDGDLSVDCREPFSIAFHRRFDQYYGLFCVFYS